MIRRLSSLVFLCTAVAASHAAAADKATVEVTKLGPLTFGISGYAGADEARADAQSLQVYLSQKLGRDVLTRVYPTPAALAAGLASGDVDLGWVQPFTLVDAQARAHVVPLVKAVRSGLPFYRGVIFTLAANQADSLPGLRGLRMGWVDPSSSAGYLFPRAAVLAAGLKPAQLFKSETFLGNHSAVCKAVAEGTVDAGATYADDRSSGKMQVDGCIQALGLDAARQLKIVLTSAPIPNDAIAARPGLDPADMNRIKQTFLELKNDHTGQMLLLSTFKAQGFDDVGPDDFTPVRVAAEAAAN